MTEQQLLELGQFLLDRFTGFVPDTKQIQNAIDDWKRSRGETQ